MSMSPAAPKHREEEESGWAWSSRQPTVLTGHTGRVWWGAWATLADGPILATGGLDGTVRLWRPEQPDTPPTVLTGHTGRVWWGAWATLADGPILATGGHDGIVRLWPVIRERPVERLPGYRSDVAAGRDELARSVEAAAVAELVTARSVLPPLAVGLFGDWGEGKSHFLDLLHARVAAAARPGNLLAHQHVRQVRFNAWHYAETDLWASLVGEMFGQLAVPSADPASIGSVDPGTAQRQQGRLAADIIDRRRLRERLAGSQARLTALQSAQKTGQEMSGGARAELQRRSSRWLRRSRVRSIRSTGPWPRTGAGCWSGSGSCVPPGHC